MKLFRRIQYIFQSRRNDADLAEELAFHHAMKQAEYEAEGLSAVNARSAAARDLGNMTQAREEARQVWISRYLEAFWQDVRYGARTLLQNPGFTAVALIALTFGIGLNAVLFTVFNAVTLQPWSVRDAKSVVSLFRYANTPGQPAHYSGYSHASAVFLNEN